MYNIPLFQYKPLSEQCNEFFRVKIRSYSSHLCSYIETTQIPCKRWEKVDYNDSLVGEEQQLNTFRRYKGSFI